jgi:nicotinamidase-related amidase
MTDAPLTPAKTALLTIDLQNDFRHPQGVCGRAGQGAAAIAALPTRGNR